MSKTKTGGKAAGYEYWSRRPFSQSTPGSFSKRRTHKAERQQGKKQAEPTQYEALTTEFYCTNLERYIDIEEEYNECYTCNFGHYPYDDCSA